METKMNKFIRVVEDQNHSTNREILLARKKELNENPNYKESLLELIAINFPSLWEIYKDDLLKAEVIPFVYDWENVSLCSPHLSPSLPIEDKGLIGVYGASDNRHYFCVGRSINTEYFGTTVDFAGCQTVSVYSASYFARLKESLNEAEYLAASKKLQMSQEKELAEIFKSWS